MKRSITINISNYSSDLMKLIYHSKIFLHSRIVFFDDSATEPIQDSDNSGSVTTVDAGEDEDYYYYYDFNNDDDFSVSDFPDYEDYQLGNRRHKDRGKCIKVVKKDAKNKEWVRKIGPLWRSLAQQIGVRRCKTTRTAQEKSDAIRFGI